MVKKFRQIESQLVFAEQAESAIALTNEQKLSLYKKSQKSGISTDVLEKVYRRGYSIWNESFGQTPEQFAFDRVNSFIAGGFAAELDEDLMINEGKRGLWDNIHAKRERIKHGSGERMRKPGSKGAPTDAAIKASQNEEADPCWDGYKQVGMKMKKGKQVPNCVPEAVNPAQQAAIAIAMKKAGKKPKNEEYTGAEKVSNNPDDPSNRFIGTTSLTNNFKQATPGQSTLSTIKKVVREQLEEMSVPAGTTGKRKDWSPPMVGVRMASGKIEKHPPGKSGSSGGGNGGE